MYYASYWPDQISTLTKFGDIKLTNSSIFKTVFKVIITARISILFFAVNDL